MICDNPVTDTVLSVGRHTRRFCARFDQVAKQICFIIVMGALQDSGDTLQPHTGVNRGFGQVNAVCQRFVAQTA